MTSSTDAGTGQVTAPRRKRDREATERQLLDMALQLMRREGVLAGLNLAHVADEAGVNRGLIYQYFGTRQNLLRAAIERNAWKATVQKVGHSLPFFERRLAVLKSAFADPERFKLMALLVLDGDNSVPIFSNLDQTRANLARDQQTGSLHPDRDALASHLVTIMMYIGYGIFRERMSEESGIAIDELDQRMWDVIVDVLQHLASSPQEPWSGVTMGGGDGA